MQRLGHRVSILNLLQFSNHTGYGSWGGQAISAKELEEVLTGLEKIKALHDLDAVVSGYIGSIEQAYLIRDFIVTLKKQHPNVIYCCDPVMGDDDRGIYVKPTIAEFIQTEIIRMADWVTPNAFELSLLADSRINNREDALLACQKLLRQFPSLQGILATSISNIAVKNGMLLVTRHAASS
ncbi:MAG: pyridoxal kinase [Gammaproteobacteria bacterium]|nr:pyridoxal kinase [Gammaproteobacteria bacterium]